jgi:hypothetical protein
LTLPLAGSDNVRTCQPASYNEPLAKKLAAMGMPCFGCTPDKLPELLATVPKGNDLKKFAETADKKSEKS